MFEIMTQARSRGTIALVNKTITYVTGNDEVAVLHLLETMRWPSETGPDGMMSDIELYYSLPSRLTGYHWLQWVDNDLAPDGVTPDPIDDEASHFIKLYEELSKV